VMKIYDWYCQGLSASSDNHRRTVVGEIDAQIPSVIACAANSAHDHRDSANPLSAGGLQAIALTRATWTGVNFGRRPDRFASPSDATPGAAHQRRRHLRTVSSQIPSRRAIWALASPAAATRTISARVTRRCSVRPARVIRSNSRRCEPVKAIRSVLFGDILALHDEFPLVTPDSPVTRWMVVNDTPIRQDHHHGRTARVDENVPATAAVRPRANECPQLAGVDVRFRGAFAYVTAHMPDTEPMPLMRLRYGGSAARWGFALYLASKDGYQDSVLPSGDLAGAPEDALDTAGGLYLGDPTAWT
jgi:hypothetical protein